MRLPRPRPWIEDDSKRARLWLTPEVRTIEADRDEVRIVLARGICPLVRVTDPTGRLVAHSEVRVSEGLLRNRRVSGCPAGTARPGPLDPNRRYSLVVHGSARGSSDTIVEGSRALESRRIENWVPVDTTVSLDWAPQRQVEAPPAEPAKAEPESEGNAALHLRLPCGSGRVSAVIAPDGGGAARRVSSSVPEDSIEGLDANESYTIRAIGIGAGFALEARGLRPGAERVELMPVPGETITGRIEMPLGVDHADVEVSRGKLRTSTGNTHLIHRDGRFEVSGLLPGRWKLEFSVRARSRWFDAEFETETGSPPVVVTLRPLER